MHTTRTLATAIALSALILSGCTPTESDITTTGKGWDTDIQALRDQATGTPHEAQTLRVLEDNTISDEEILELAHQHTQCMHDAGYTDYHADPITNDFLIGYNLDDNESQKAQEQDQLCANQTNFLFIHSIYSTMRQNPNNAAQEDIIAACLVKLGVVDPSYTGQQFQEEFTGYMEAHSDNEGKVSGDPYDAISYTVEKSQGKEALAKCINEPQTVLDFTQGSSK